MTLLDDILAASYNSSRSTADLLRMVQIVARRVGAREIEQWARHEIGGYIGVEDLPSYRRRPTGVKGTFTGPFNGRITYSLTAVPDGLDSLWTAVLRQPLQELQSLADSEGEGEPTIPWPSAAVALYEESGVFRIEGYGLFEAHQVLTRQSLRGIVDSIKSKAMEFALDLQEQFPDAGEPGGPTIATQPALAQTVFNITNNITGHGANVAAGSQISQSSRVLVGDAEGLRREAAALGLPEVDADELVAAVEAERDVSGPRTASVLEKVRSKVITLGGTLGSDVVVGLLTELIKQYLGTQ